MLAGDACHVPAQLVGRMLRKGHGQCSLSCTIQGVPLALQVEACVTSCATPS